MDLTKSKFLIADDSAMICDLIESALKKLGANRVDRVDNGKEALQKIRRAANESMPYALVTLDWEMPELSGLEVLKAVRADPAAKTQRVLMITSKASPDDLRQLAPLQPNGYVVKPFTEEALLQRIQAVLAPKPGAAG